MRSSFVEEKNISFLNIFVPKCGNGHSYNKQGTQWAKGHLHALMGQLALHIMALVARDFAQRYAVPAHAHTFLLYILLCQKKWQSDFPHGNNFGGLKWIKVWFSRYENVAHYLHFALNPIRCNPVVHWRNVNYGTTEIWVMSPYCLCFAKW